MSASIDLIHSQPDSAQILTRQVDRIMRSTTFGSSEVLRNLLSFLAACALEGRSESVKVKEIATVVFGRSEDFDSQSDSVVRVHMGRLRSKLAEYYVGEGAEDEPVISIPKGSYALSWHPRHHAAAFPEAPAVPELPQRRILLVFALILSSVAAAFWVGSSLRGRYTEQRSKPALTTFWNGFVAGKEIPLIVFSNLKLVGSLQSGMHLFRGDPADREKPLINSWTTIGEVMGVFEITRTLSLFQKSARAKNGQLLTWDDAKDSNLIFVGGPLADTPVRDIAIFRDFQFKNSTTGIPAESGAVINVKPHKGEPPIYFGPETRPFPFDYAVVSLRPAFNRMHRVLALAGITEYGTAGAAEFVTREDALNELLSRLNVKPGESMPWFEALLRVKVEGGVPVQYEIVLVHKAG
jgi:hypothetical protein